MNIFSNTSAIALTHRMEGYVPVCLQVYKNTEFQIQLSNLQHSSKVCAVFSILSNHDYVEALFILDALRNIDNIQIILPYLFYGRSDQEEEFFSFNAKLIQKTMEFKNVSHIYLLDPHSNFFSKPTTILSAAETFEKDIKMYYNPSDVVLISPDKGAAGMAKTISERMKCPYYVCEKRRDSMGRISSVNITADVGGKTCVIVDDMVDSGDTLLHVSHALSKMGAAGSVAYCTHGVLSDGVDVLLKESQLLEVVVTDSICKPGVELPLIRRISVIPLLNSAIEKM